MKKTLVGSFTSATHEFTAVPAGKQHHEVCISLLNKHTAEVDFRVRLKRGRINYRLEKADGVGARDWVTLKSPHILEAGDRLTVLKTGGNTPEAVYTLSYDEVDAAAPADPAVAALGEIKTAVEGVGTDLDELTTKLGEVLGTDSDVVAQLTLAAASADLLTKLGELKTAVDGFEPVRVVLPPAVAGANLDADVVTADTALTDVYQDVASVEITPQSDAADMRIWLTLFWQGRMTYRVMRGTDEVVSEQSLDSTSGMLPVSYPVAHSPASTAAQTYKLQAKRAQAGTSTDAKVGTTLYVEEIYGG